MLLFLDSKTNKTNGPIFAETKRRKKNGSPRKRINACGLIRQIESRGCCM
jgi:hypothetical protein